MIYRLKLGVVLSLLCIIGFPAVSMEPPTERLEMFVGEVKVYSAIDVARVALGNGGILKVEPKDTGDLILIAQDVGTTTLRIWQEDGIQRKFNVTILARDPDSRIRLEDIVRIKVRMVEVRKSATDKLGIDWAESINGPAFSTVGDFASNGLFRSPGDSGISGTLPLNVAPFSTHFGLATSIQSKINMLASTGDATTLAEPTLSCVNGGKADFLAGGQIPYPVTGSNGQTSVEFKDYGISLNISPVADSTGKIYTSIATEISQIDASVSVLGAPGILTRRTQTEMNVLSGQTIVISGLLSADTSVDVNGVPWLSDIPILGNLFKSQSFVDKKSELVVFVTPELIRARDMELSEYQKDIYNQGDQTLINIQKNLGLME